MTLYNPESAFVTELTLGFCEVELKLFGPVQLYVAPASVLAFRSSVENWHSGPLLEAEGAAGVALTVIFTESVFWHPVAAIVSVSVYMVVVTGLTDGLDVVSVNPEGLDVQLYLLPVTDAAPIFVD